MTKTHNGLGANPRTRPNTAPSNPAPVGAGAGGRRSLFGGPAAAMMLPAVAPLATAVALEPDAMLIQLCAEFIAATHAYDTAGGTLDNEEDDPLWHAFRDAAERVESIPATTLAGVIAKARVVVFLAKQPNGTEQFDTAFTLDWPEQVVRDLLALGGAA